ncbi:hypothetical protein S83_060195, partial [Arachis hypogaea]
LLLPQTRRCNVFTSRSRCEPVAIARRCHSFLDYSKTYARSKYYDKAKPWNERCDVAFACASQNEIEQFDAINLVNAGCRLLVEGSNMPFTPEAADFLKKASVLIAPTMAAGTGGVVAGELELNRECSLMHWSPEDFESKLQGILINGQFPGPTIDAVTNDLKTPGDELELGKILMRAGLGTSLPLSSISKSEEETLFRKVLFDALLLVEYPFLYENSKYIKGLSLTRLIVTHKAVEYF